MTTIPITTERPTLCNHRRLPKPLEVLPAGEGLALRRAVWAPLVDGRPEPNAPLAVRGVCPAQAAIARESPVTFWPATIFPDGFRRQVAGALRLRGGILHLTRP